MAAWLNCKGAWWLLTFAKKKFIRAWIEKSDVVDAKKSVKLSLNAHLPWTPPEFGLVSEFWRAWKCLGIVRKCRQTPGNFDFDRSFESWLSVFELIVSFPEQGCQDSGWRQGFTPRVMFFQPGFSWKCYGKPGNVREFNSVEWVVALLTVQVIIRPSENKHMTQCSSLENDGYTRSGRTFVSFFSFLSKGIIHPLIW